MKLVPAREDKAGSAVSHGKDTTNMLVFFMYSICLSTLIGLLIPSDYVKRAVNDYMWNFRTENLAHYLFISLLISLGFFLVWGGIYYYIAKNKKLVTGVLVSITIFALIDYFVFYRNESLLNNFQYELYSNSFFDGPLNLIVLALAGLLIIIIIRNTNKVFIYIAIPLLLAVVIVCASNMNYIINTNNEYAFTENQRDYPQITLSADKPNVVIIMLDRAVGRVVPYIFSEHSELINQFDGFTWYRNSLSFGQGTNMGIPALYGGYEYTPSQLNNRSNETLRDKHDEALCVMPVIFGENGYSVTILDPAYAGYEYVPDLSIYDDYPYINAYVANEILNPYFNDLADSRAYFFERDFFMFGIRLAAPIGIRDFLYDNGYYNDMNRRLLHDTHFQSIQDISHASGYNLDYLNAYYTLVNLSNITTITTESESGSFVFIDNVSTHEPTILEEPSYTASLVVDNSEYDQQNAARFVQDNIELELYYPEEMGHYQTQVAAYQALGDWFDYLRDQGLYDNTRIIIVSDHGARYWLFGDTNDRDGNSLAICAFNCLFMIKDFNQTGFTTSDVFITNADTPSMAFNNLIADPINPFTNNPIRSNLDETQDFLYFASLIHNVTENNGNAFLPGDWYRYDPSYGDIYNEEAWEYVGYY